MYLSNPKPGHTPGGTVRGGPGGTAAPGGDGQHRTPTTGLLAKETTNPLIPRRWKNDLLGVPLEARTREILCKPMEEQNHRFNRGTKSALRSWLLTTVPTPICLCKPFSCKACPGM